MKKTILVVIMSLSILSSGCSKKDQVRVLPMHHVDVMVVGQYDVPYNFDYPGSVQGFVDFPVIARISGVIFKQFYTEGSYVKKNQVLYEIDKRPYQNQLNADQGQLVKDSTALLEYKSILERYKRLYRISAVSRQDVETATINYKSALGQVQTDKGNIANDKLNIEYCEVRSPADGLISERQVTVGQMVTAYQTVLNNINSKSNLYILFSVPENDRLTLQQGMKSGIIVAPKKLKFNMDLELADGTMLYNAGLVSFFDTRISLQNGTWNMRGDINDNKLSTQLLSGQFVHVYLSGAKFRDAFAVPQSAVFRDNQGGFVYVVQGINTIKKRYVTPGMMTGELWIIQSGLNNGDKVVVDGGMKVKDGDKVIVDKIGDQTKLTASDAI